MILKIIFKTVAIFLSIVFISTTKIHAGSTQSSLKSTLHFNGHPLSVNSVAYSPDGKNIASGSDDSTVKIWDAVNGELLKTLIGHKGGVCTVTYSPDGKYIASGSRDNTIKIWNVQSGKLHRHISSVVGTFVLVQGKPVPDFSNAVKSVAFSPDGSRVVAASGDRSIRIWDTDTCAEIRTLINPDYSTGEISVAYRQDGKQIISGLGNLVYIWDAETGESSHVFRHLNATSVAYSPDGRSFVVGGKVMIWDADTWENIQQFHWGDDWALSVAYSPDGKHIASGHRNHSVRIWDVESGKELHKLTGSHSRMNSVAYRPDGKYIVSGSRDGSIWLWKVPNIASEKKNEPDDSIMDNENATH